MPISEAHALTILLACQEVEEPLSAKDLAGRLCIDKSNVSRMCARMMKRGTVIAESCPRDGRVKCLRLTEQGKAIAQELELASAKKFSALTKQLPKGETPAIIEALKQLSEAVRNSR